ncbi:MAG: hypothetical protein HY291_20685 [Planctomycetes bacterium]|nr:hypothetical protein [Planctomycetota bacterium]
MSKKSAEPEPAFSLPVKPPEKPVALYYRSRANSKAAKPQFDELSQRVAKLKVEPVEGDEEGAHWLHRYDKDGQEVWSTRHPSLRETFWYAEWEYGIPVDQWGA